MKEYLRQLLFANYSLQFGECDERNEHHEQKYGESNNSHCVSAGEIRNTLVKGLVMKVSYGEFLQYLETSQHNSE